MNTTTITASEVTALHSDTEIGPVARLASKAGPASQAWETVRRVIIERATAATLAQMTQTCESTPFFMWHSAVVGAANVSDADARRLAGALLHERYHAGVMARDIVAELARAVRRGLIDERVESERRAAKLVLRTARGL